MAYEVKAVLTATAGGFVRGFKEARAALDGFGDASKGGLESVGRVMKSAGKAMTVGLTAPLVTLGTLSAKSAIEFESAMTGVAKTIDMTSEEFDAMAKSIQGMSREMPASTTEIAAVAEAAGQLGIKKESILDFTRTMIDMGEATNLSSEEAASSLAQFANITGMTQDKFSNLGSTIVALGNSFATTEADIVRMGQRLAASGSMIGLTEAEIMGLSAAMSSVGINAEAGGSAFSRVMQKINSEVLSGGAKLEGFAQVAGMSADHFASAWQERPSEAITAFVEGLKRVQDSGGDVTGVLEELGITSLNEVDTLMRLAGAAGLLPEAFDMANMAFAENTALSEEAALRYETLESKIEIFKNTLAEAGQVIGAILLPVLISMVEGLTGIAQAFSNLPEPIQQVVVVFGAILAAIGPLLMMFGSLLMALPMLSAGFGMLAGVLPAIGAAFAFLTTPVGLAVAAILALIGVITHLWNTNEGFREAVISAWNAIKDAISTVAEAIAPVVQGAWDAIKNVISTVHSAIKGDTEAQWDLINMAIKAALTVAETIVSGGLNIIKGVVGTVMGAIKGVVSSNWDAIKSKVSSAMDAIKSAVTDKWNAAKDAASKALDGMKSAAQSGMDSIKSAVSTAMDNVRSTVAEKWNAVKTATTETLSSMVSGVTSGMANVVSAVTSGMGNALSAITGFIGQFRSVGSNIAQAVASGIAAGASAAVQAAIGLARRALNAAKAALGIASPSKEFLAIGGYVAEGLAAGIDKNSARAGKAAEDMGLDVIKAMPEAAYDIGGQVKSLSSLPQQVMSLAVDSKGNKGQALTVTLNLGGRNFRAFVDDISQEQGREVDLVEAYGI